MLFTLLGLCVGLAAGTQDGVLTNFDLSKVVTVTMNQIQCFPVGIRPFPESAFKTLHKGYPLLLELSRLLYPLEGRDTEWLSGSQILADGALGQSFLHPSPPVFRLLVRDCLCLQDGCTCLSAQGREDGSHGGPAGGEPSGSDHLLLQVS